MKLSTTSRSRARTLQPFHQNINYVSAHTFALPFQHFVLSMDDTDWDHKKKKTSPLPSQDNLTLTPICIQRSYTIHVNTSSTNTSIQPPLHIQSEHGLVKKDKTFKNQTQLVKHILSHTEYTHTTTFNMHDKFQCSFNSVLGPTQHDLSNESFNNLKKQHDDFATFQS